MKYLIAAVFLFVLVLVFGVFTQPVSAHEDIIGSITSNTTWQTGKVYVVYGTVTVDSGVVLTIEPGAIVKFNSGASMAVFGSVIADGTSGSEIYLTSIRDDSIGGDTNGDGANTVPTIGDWAQIWVALGANVDMDYSVVRFGGVWPYYTAIYQTGGILSLTNSIIEANNTGLRIDSGSSTVEGNVFSGNSSGMEVTGLGSLTLNNNSFVNNLTNAVIVYFNDVRSFISLGNTASGNGRNGILVFGTVQTDQTWTDQMSYIISGSGLTVSTGSTLTLNAGTKVKFDGISSQMIVLGNLSANGTLANQVYLTSAEDDSVGGDTNGDGASNGFGADWGQIITASGASVDLSHSVVRFGGGSWPHYSNIAMSGGNLNLSNSTISFSGSTGLRIYDGSASIINSQIMNNVYGIVKEGGSVLISNSSISDNSEYGIYNGTFSEINAEDNWWGDATGPYNFWNNDDGGGDKVSTFIDFDPWLTSPPVFNNPPVLTKEPVIIVPGILGSRLNRVSDGKEVWPSMLRMAVPGSDDYLNELKLDDNGGEILDIYPSEIIESVLLINQYGALIQKFKDNGYVLGQNLFIVPYDWRLDIQISSLGLDPVIADALINSPTGRVNIVAHSMGGLLVRDYLMRNGESAVNKIIFAGTPHLGAPKAFNLLNWGDDFDIKFIGLGLNKNKAKDIAQNMPASYQLLPSREYLNNAGSYVELNNGVLSYDETREFMSSNSVLPDHRNNQILSLADNFHQSHDSWTPQSADIYNLLGCREYETIGSFNIESDGSVDINSITGDGTVPFISASHISGENYYVLYPATKINHMGLISEDRTIGIIYDIVTDSPTILPNGISKEANFCEQVVIDFKRLRFSTHSPVNLHVYDSLGNHTGYNSDGVIEINIPDSNFIQAGDSSFIFVPDGTEYSALVDAYATGSFDFKVKVLINGEVNESIIFDDVPINDSGLDARFEFINMTNPGTLDVDRDGDGVVDAGYLPDGSWIPYNVTIQSILDDLEMVYVLGWIEKKAVKNSLIQKLNTAIRVEKRIELLEEKLPNKPQITKRIERLEKQLDKVLGTAFLNQLEKEYNKGRINKKAYNILRADILWLLGN